MRPGNNFLDLFMADAPKEETLKAAREYFGGQETISIVSQDQEKKATHVRSLCQPSRW